MLILYIIQIHTMLIVFISIRTSLQEHPITGVLVMAQLHQQQPVLGINMRIVVLIMLAYTSMIQAPLVHGAIVLKCQEL